jgi:hypothetical protein
VNTVVKEYFRELFGEVADRYDENPVKFIEELFRKRPFVCIQDDSCADCALWGQLTGKPRLVHKKDHASPENKKFMAEVSAAKGFNFTHRFSPNYAFYPLGLMSPEQVLHHAERLGTAEGDGSLLFTYHDLKMKRDPAWGKQPPSKEAKSKS